MEKLFHLVVMFTACCAVPQDLSGKMMNFPVESTTAFVRLYPSRQNFNSVSVCLRFSTYLRRSHSLFSMASLNFHNYFLLFTTGIDGLEVSVRNHGTVFQKVFGELSGCVSICGTWDSGTGSVQVWINGKPSSKEPGFHTGILNEMPVIILGQEQDTAGGGFDINQSFVGLITDVHMWDYVLSPVEIQHYTNDFNFTPGNILNWGALEYISQGNVIVENNQIPCYY